MNLRLKEIRTVLQLSQAEFGEKIGCSQTTIAGYENGVRSPSTAVLKSISREFNVDPRWLESGEGSMFIQQSRSDELAAFFGSLTRDPDGSFRAALITELAKLDLESWQALEAFCSRVVESKDKKR